MASANKQSKSKQKAQAGKKVRRTIRHAVVTNKRVGTFCDDFSVFFFFHFESNL